MTVEIDFWVGQIFQIDLSSWPPPAEEHPNHHKHRHHKHRHEKPAHHRHEAPETRHGMGVEIDVDRDPSPEDGPHGMGVDIDPKKPSVAPPSPQPAPSPQPQPQTPVPPQPPTPQPPAPPEPPNRPKFSPPPQSRQPTLRPGDESPDGWVEYMQELLGIQASGKYDGTTEKAVKAFQASHGCQVDGVVGNQTWSVLRHEKKEAVGTDQRPKHSFEEKGAEARWYLEDKFAVYNKSADSVSFTVESVGDDTDISKHKATFRITPPSGKDGVVELPIGPPVKVSPTGQGNQHQITITAFKATYPADNGAVGEYKVEAYLDAELGGDRWNGVIVDKAPAPQPQPKPKPHQGPEPQKPDPEPHVEPVDPHNKPVDPVDPKPQPKGLIDLIKQAASLVARIYTEFQALKSWGAANAFKIGLACPMASAKFIAAAAGLVTATEALMAALVGDAAVVAEEFTLPATLGLIWAVVKAIGAVKDTGEGLVKCMQEPDHAEELKSLTAELQQHLNTISGFEKELEGMGQDIRKLAGL